MYMCMCVHVSSLQVTRHVSWLISEVAPKGLKVMELFTLCLENFIFVFFSKLYLLYLFNSSSSFKVLPKSHPFLEAFCNLRS